MRAIVTGGAGFIGSCLARLLIQGGHDVLVIDKLTYAGNESSLSEVRDSPRYRFAHADICDGILVSEIFNDFEPDAVFHLAAESHVDRSISGADVFLQTNVFGTFQLLQAARSYWGKLVGPRADAFRFLHASTDEVYGSADDGGLFTEQTPYRPRSPYSASKAASDHFAQAWHHTYGLPVLISNCSNNYGPYQLPEKLIPLMILNALDGRDLPIYGDGGHVRDWLFVEDHARALIAIVENGRVGETYNVGGGNERTNLHVVQRICDFLDGQAPAGRPHRRLMKHVADRPGHDRRYGIDATKIETELGWRAAENFETGIERTISWYMSNAWWWRPLREAGHGLSRLGFDG